jgi:hypothetical protein
VPFVACKNYVSRVPKYVGNYTIPTANGNVKGAVTLAGAGILNFQNIYI